MHPAKPVYRTWRHHLGFPGVLWPAIQERSAELGRPNVPNYLVELVCYDLRTRCEHDVTGPLAKLPPDLQDAVDRAILGSRSRHSGLGGGTLEALVNDEPLHVFTVQQSTGPLVKEYVKVRFPARHHAAILERHAELEFETVSEYVTSLVRYDLLLSGPHKYFRNENFTHEILDSLDEATLREFHAKERPRTKAQHLVQQAAGRELTPEETTAALRKVAEKLIEVATRRVRKEGGNGSIA